MKVLFTLLSILSIFITALAQEPGLPIHNVTWNAVNQPSGIYFYELRAGGFVQTKKMVLLK